MFFINSATFFLFHSGVTTLDGVNQGAPPVTSLFIAMPAQLQSA